MKKLGFLKDKRGAVFIIIALCFVSMVGITATAIDYARGSLLKAEMVSALDAATLAGGSVANSSSMSATATKYFNVNMPSNFMGSTVDPLNIQLATDRTTLRIGTAAHMNNSMMQVVNWRRTNVASNTEVTIERKGMEVVLVLDNTGSMGDPAGGGVSKITALKSASRDLINILYGSHTTLENLWVGLVPFAQGVNIGSTRASWTSGNPNWGTTASWMGCVEAREASNRDVTDDPPSVALFPKYYSVCNNSNGDGTPNGWYGNNTTNRNGSGTYNNCSTGSGVRYKTPTATFGPNAYCTQAVTPLASNKNTVLNAIDTMQENGSTFVNLGLVWGWRMLSPRWQNQWGGEMNTNHLPLAYNTPLMTKVIVLLTDGDNSFGNNNYTAYGLLSANRIGTTNVNNATTILNARTTQVCNSLRSNHILVYVVALGTSINSTSRTMLRNCATLPAYYFESPTTAALQDAFHSIGDSLSNLRISQ